MKGGGNYGAPTGHPPTHTQASLLKGEGHNATPSTCLASSLNNWSTAGVQKLSVLWSHFDHNNEQHPRPLLPLPYNVRPLNNPPSSSGVFLFRRSIDAT